jgi:hypothetical protein
MFLIMSWQTTKVILLVDGGKCLTYVEEQQVLSLNECIGSSAQQWKFGFENKTAFKLFNSTFGY